ncbi:MAG: hypothetical protein IJ858_08730, partial [Acidaminococcaceae bacterium]|nr:hypothetical protein [Acidaminococcaceae bacterium]
MSANSNCYGCSMTGIRRVAGFSPDCAIVLHSPKACGQIIREKDGYVLRRYTPGEDRPVPIFTSNISGTNAIFGAQDQLEECLVSAIRSCNPRYILVGSSCVVGVIGDDVASVCHKVSEQYHVPVFAIPCCGFMNGGYEAGMVSAARFLIDTFVFPGSTPENEVILCGILDKTNNYEYDFIRDALSLWDIKINAVFPGYTDVRQMKELNRARAILLCGSYTKIADPYREIATCLGQKLSIPVIAAPDPIGLKKSLEWLRAVGTKLNIEPGILDESIQSLENEFTEILTKRKPFLEKKTAVLYFPGLPKIPVYLNWLKEFAELAGIAIKGIIISHLEEKPTYATVDEVILPLRQLGFPLCDESILSEADFVFTLRRMGNAPDNYVQIPYIHAPFGAHGFRDFADQVFRCERKQSHTRQVL